MYVVELQEGIYINFKSLTLSDKPIFDKYFWQQRYENAHSNFTNLYMWRKAFDIQWCILEEVLCVKAAWDGETFVLQPFGAEKTALCTVLDNMLDYFKSIDAPFSMRGVEASMTELIKACRPGLFTFTPDRDNFDYVYNAQDLTELKGRKYHSKKNHVNSFKRNYPDYSYMPLSNGLVEDCIRTAGLWYDKKQDDDVMLHYEYQAILEVLNNFEYLGVKGGVITLYGNVEAFAFGEPLNNDTAVIHVEKANPDIKGIYSVINQEFCHHQWSDMLYINREEDMGVEGLRKAKQSYHPVKMIEKFVIA